MAVAGLGRYDEMLPMAATATPAPTGLGSRQAAWQGSKPQYAKPTKGMSALDVALQQMGDIRGLQFVTNKGNAAGIKAKETKEKGAVGDANLSGFVPLVNGATYRIRDEKGKDEIVYEGVGEEGLRNVYAIAQDLSAKKGKKANWGVEMQLPGTDTWRRVADDDPAKGIGGVLDVLGDAALGLLVAGPIGAAVGAGLSVAGVNVSDIAYPILGTMVLGPVAGSMAGSAVSSAVQGRSLEDALIRAGISGLTAGAIETIPGASEAISGIGNAIGLDKALQAGFLPEISGAAVGSSIPTQVVGNELIVTGGSNALAAPVASGIGGALSGAASGVIAPPAPSAPAPQAPSPPAQEAGAGDITVTAAARNARIDAAVAALLNPATNTITNPAIKDLPPDELAEAQERANAITVTAGQQSPGTTAGIGGEAGSTTGGSNSSPQTDGEEITVTAPTIPGTVVPIGAPLVPTGPVNQPVTPSQPATTQPPGPSTMDYIRLALSAPNLINGIGGLLGAGGDNTRLTRGSSPLNYTPLTRTQTGATTPGAAGAPGFDVFTYGQNKPGAQQAEYTFFQPYSLAAAPQSSTVTSASPIYTQADVDTANAAIMNQYAAGLSQFNAYQDTLAQQVASGALTPAAAQAAATQFAASLGYAPATAAPAMAEGGEVDDDMVRHLVEYSKGTGHRGPGKVSGIGSGQEDLIPAWLSDGEYVWSAQDVADLGDGSTDEGVRRLDKMRQMVRKQAGRKDVKNIAKPQKSVDKMLKAVGGPV